MTQEGSSQPRRSRRRFLYELGVVGIGGFVSFLVAWPLVGYAFSVLMKRSSLQWVRVCSLDQVNTVTPTEFRVAFKGENASVTWQDVRGIFVIRKGDQIFTFTNVCAHMGCSVRWLDWRQQILCPCHGGMYDRWGILIGGPPPRNLPLYVSKVEDNQLFVANRYLQEEVRQRAPGY